MVLELSDRREGGKSCWVPVTQKTYWPPPPPTCSTPGSTVRQESSASFSVSDDSSVQSQSSPWQRETRWKNPNPCRVTSSEGISFHTKQKQRCRCSCTLRRKPFSVLGPGSEKNSLQCAACKVKRKCKRPSVIIIASKLLDKALGKKMCVAESSSSPRKRLLRDMEKVRLNAEAASKTPWNTLKKAKAILPPTPLPTHSATTTSASVAFAAAVAASHSLEPTKVYDRQSSYSIDSLLNKERQEASSKSSFLRSLLGKAPPASVVAGSTNGVALKNSKPHAVFGQPRLSLTSQPPDVVPTAVAASALQAVLAGSRAPVWLPYSNVGSLHQFVPPPVPINLARPGPSSRTGVPVTRQPIDGRDDDSDDDDDDDAPLNLTTTRGRES